LPAEPRIVAEAPPPLRASIVIPVHNRINLTRACLSALRRQTLQDAEIIVVDDGSNPVEAAELGAFANEVRVIRLQSGSGFAAACNAGAAIAGGRHIVLLNNDVLPIAGWLEALERYADQNPRAGIVGARLLWPDRSVQHAGVVVSSSGHLIHLYAGMPGDHPAVCRSRRIRIVTGATMLIRREAWDELGGLDAGFHNSFEDVDLCLRAGKHGYEVHVCGDAVLMHLELASRGPMPLADEDNWRRLLDRWGKLEPDDLSIYAADGLVSARYVLGGVEVAVDPNFGSAVATEPAAVDQLLNRRSREVFLLREENRRLRAQADDPWDDLTAARGAPSTDDPTVTVIVALCDHGHVDQLLDALEAQTVGPGSFEVLVVNPGEVLPLAAARALARPRLRIQHLDAVGSRAAAWNRGIQHARTELVILLADDFIPVAEFVEHHVRLHRENPAAELVGIGPARFPDRIRRDHFARWIEDSGELFGVPFSRLAGELPAGWFYCANTSAKRAFLIEAGGFDERFPAHAGDDAELGLRLAARGMVNAYVQGALTVHDHPLTLRERRRQMRDAGQATAVHDSIYPRPHAWNSGTDEREPPTRAATTWARLRHLVRRRDADHALYYERLLERARIDAYRRAAKLMDPTLRAGPEAYETRAPARRTDARDRAGAG
jgi:GT2 family glycosyltransferase